MIDKSYTPKPSTIAEVVDALRSERVYQQIKWGTTSPEVDQHPSDFIVCMEYYMHKVLAEATNSPSVESALEMLRKVIALALAMFENDGVPLDTIVKNIIANRAEGKDYRGLPYSVYLLRIETCLLFARRDIITTGEVEKAKNWILDLINHGISCFESWGVSPRLIGNVYNQRLATEDLY